MSKLHFLCFPRAALTHVPPGKLIPSEGHSPMWCFCSQDFILFYKRAPFDTVGPVRTDIACLQLCWMMRQVFRRRVLKSCTDFFESESDWNVSPTHLWTYTDGHGCQPRLSQKWATWLQGLEHCLDTSTKQKRLNRNVFNKHLPGWWRNCVENSSQMPTYSQDIR